MRESNGGLRWLNCFAMSFRAYRHRPKAAKKLDGFPDVAEVFEENSETVM